MGMTSWTRRVDLFFWNADLRPLALYTILSAILLGLFLLLGIGNPGIVLVFFKTHWIGLWLVCIGMLKTYALVREHKWLLILCGALHLWTWGMLLVASIVLTSAAPGGIVSYLMLAVAATWIWVRHMGGRGLH